MYALFTSVPLVGHANPLLRQAEELHRRGWRVAFAGAREIEAHVKTEVSSVTFLDLGPIGAAADRLREAQARASLDASFVRGTRCIIDALWALWPSMYDGLVGAMAADRPDVLVADLFSTAGVSAAEAAGVRCIVNNPDLLGAISVRVLPPADALPFLFSGRSVHDVPWWQPLAAPLVRRVAAVAASVTVGRELNRQRASRGLSPMNVHDLVRDRPVLVDGAFGLEYPRPLPPNIAMVGAMLPSAVPPLPADFTGWLSEGPPVVYVNMGTLAVLPPAQLAKMADALSHERFRVLWIRRSAGTPGVDGSIRSGVRVLDWGPAPLAVLSHPNVKVFVSHCGINSVYEAVRAGTPIVGIPMFADQRDMAVRVADAGIGVWLDKRRFTADELRDAVLRVLGDDAMRRALPGVQRALDAAGGVGRAADLIEDHARAA
jgi:UDP:flavonoid glycosyltransferase YjiC (YdhE family)